MSCDVGFWKSCDAGFFNTDVETSFGGKEIKSLSVLEIINCHLKIEKIAWDGGCGKGGRRPAKYGNCAPIQYIGKWGWGIGG